MSIFDPVNPVFKRYFLCHHSFAQRVVHGTMVEVLLRRATRWLLLAPHPTYSPHPTTQPPPTNQLATPLLYYSPPATLHLCAYMPSCFDKNFGNQIYWL